ncbi:MAG TPA: hypothetical protein VJZ72_04235, partial [Candidatus Limnocylindrales bacterium]|nr:hypothetical protein [Candidatus Limnocylindrales bacterium]
SQTTRHRPPRPDQKGAGTRFFRPDGTSKVVGAPLLLFDPDGGVREIGAGLVVFDVFDSPITTHGLYPDISDDALVALYCP